MTTRLRCFSFAVTVALSAAMPAVYAADAASPATAIPQIMVGAATEMAPPKDGLLLIVSRLPLASDKAGNPQIGWLGLEPTAKPNVYCQKELMRGSISAASIQLDDKKNVITQLADCGDSRLQAGTGTPVRIMFVDTIAGEKCPAPLSLPQLKAEEKERDTLLSLQIRQLASHIIGTGKGKSLVPKTMVCAWTWPDYELTLKRAEIVIKTADAVAVTPKPAVTPPVAAEPNVPASTPSDLEPFSLRIITGPIEHAFLSVDAIVKGADQLKYDEGSKSISHKDKPEQVYLGVNYMLGDVYGTLPAFDLKRTVVKFMFTPNKQLDSVGVGIGYRLPGSFKFLTGKNDSEDHSGFVLFVGRFWTKGEKLSGTVPVQDSHREASTRFGLSYSFGTALEWLLPKK